ncbi:DUF4139 domain-containing protein [Candidatus Micrarchaeota archaeon]|nr:DUF4139 domain-containing protein [Candidatus Micrarchaeota archaeon]
MRRFIILLLVFGLLTADSTSLVIYKDGVGFVNREYAESFPGGDFEKHYDVRVSLQDLYASVDSGSVYSATYDFVLKDEKVKKTLSELLDDSVGKQISFYVFTLDKTAVGVLKWHNGEYIAVDSQGSVLLYRMEDFYGLTLPVAEFEKNSEEKEYVLVVRGNRPEGTGQMNLKYFKDGLDWNVVYSLQTNGKESGNAELSANAVVSNSADEDYNQSSLTLISGAPHFLRGISPYLMNYYPEAFAAKADYDAGMAISEEISTTGFWLYRLEDKVNLGSGSQISYSLFSQSVPFKMKYEWDVNSGNTVNKMFYINNTNTRTLPEGTVRVFENFEFAGEDSLPFTPQYSEPDLFIASVPEIVVDSTMLERQSEPVSLNKERYAQGEKLEMRNTKDTQVTLYVEQSFSYYSNFEIIETSVNPYEVEGNTVRWKITLNPGQSKEIIWRYSYTY